MNPNWSLSNPYVYQALMELQNETIAVQTARGSVRGVLLMVAPDHIVVEMGGTNFYILTDQIIWFHQMMGE